MAARMDLARLREQTMGSGNDEEAVTVNTRALIDKVLARYSGDWTTLRELIQNAADASATRVIIKFETLPSRDVPVPATGDESARLKHVLQHHTLLRLTVSNNGQSFADTDWARLKRIAEGNPDETKIGAFGVGFYSVFADCEEPFVISGSRTMAFYWKGNSLFTRTGTVANAASETSFLLDYRNNTTPVPDLDSICQFLSTSLTFVGLEKIELWLDDWNVLTLAKKSAPSANISLPSDVKTKTREGLMKVVGVVHQATQIDAKWMNVIAWKPSRKSTAADSDDESPAIPTLKSLFSKFSTLGTSTTTREAARRAAREAEAAQRAIAEDVSGTSQATVFLRISTVNIQTYVRSDFAKEIERATKKPPPKHTRIAILTSSHDDVSASVGSSSGLTAKKSTDIFASVLPTRNGRVFIGFPTAQTTGMLCHISAPSVIPTVERESIDLNARWVRTWNVEMLRVAGIACRIAYAGEMEELKQRLDRRLAKSGAAKLSNDDIASVIPLATHIYKQYTPQESTPSAHVGKIIEEAFWECTDNINVLSTRGVLPSHKVRVVSQPLSFLGETPIVPQELVKEAHAFVQRLYELGLVTDMSIADIKRELEARSLDEKQLLEFLKWAGAELATGTFDSVTIHNLLNSAVATVTEDVHNLADTSSLASGQGKILVLSEVKSFLNEKKIPPDMPVPPTTIPFKFIKDIPRVQLEAFGWNELQIVPWVRYLLEIAGNARQPEEESLTASPALAKRVLPLVSKQWDSVSQSSKTTLVELLSTRTVMPTKLGMKKPPDSYFASVKLFDDLPTIDGPLGKDKFLVALGVRKTVELSVVFERLMAVKSQGTAASDAKWSFSDLVRYLVTVRDDIPSKDIERLRTTAICPIEKLSGDETKSARLHKITEIYVPSNDMRMLRLPVLQWTGPWRETSQEARFLSTLGIKAFPTVEQLITIMMNAAQTRDQELYDFAMNYFISRHHVNGYSKYDTTKIRDKPFLPLLGHQFPQLISPGACFVNEKAAILGYNILELSFKEHASKFGVATEPPIVDCVQRVISSPPHSHGDATHIFGYMAGRVADIAPGLADALGKAKIVPIIKKSDSRPARMTSPQLCFLGDKHDYDEFLDFVNFGYEGNAFLMKVGSKVEPGSIELAKVVLENPGRILSVLQQEKYLDLLRKLADQQQRLKQDKALWRQLKDARWLLAYRDVPLINIKKAGKDSEKTDAEDLLLDDEENVTRDYALARPPDIVIQDNYRYYQFFRDSLNLAPQEEALETFYAALGVPTLDSIVDVTERMGMALKSQTEADRLLRLLFQRARVFLHEYNKDKCLHDAKWLENNLSCQIVQSISTHLLLKTMNINTSFKRTAALRKDSRQPYTLFVTQGCDLYEVSSAVVRLLLKRPKRNDAMALETILVSKLQQLRERGYNVERILQQEAYRSRIAEEERQRQQVEEQKRTKELRASKPLPPPGYDDLPNDGKKTVQARGGRGEEAPPEYASEQRLSDSPDRPMPGAWDSPEANNRPKIPKFFTNIQKQLEGFRGGGGASSPGPGALTGGPSTGANGGTNKHITAGPQTVTSQSSIHNNLVSAVQACRSHNSDTVFSQPSTTTVEEQRTGSYCDDTPGQDVTLYGDSAAGIKIYVAKTLSTDARAYVTQHKASIDTFGYLLLDLGSIFGIPPQTLHIFIDERGQTIAFNQSGALFCNFHFFAQLHEKAFTPAAREGGKEARIEALSYWWVVLSHELAHNLVREHGAQHSFYAESFCQQYFGRVMVKAAQY